MKLAFNLERPCSVILLSPHGDIRSAADGYLATKFLTYITLQGCFEN